MNGLPDSTYFDHPEWIAGRFVDDEASSLFNELPQTLQAIAMAEIDLGNRPTQILRNNRRGIILLEFGEGPRSEIPQDPVLVVHTEHSYGNYCYDGTSCTVEDVEAGGFVAFLDPTFDADAL